MSNQDINFINNLDGKQGNQNTELDLKYWVGFSGISKIGPSRFKKLYNYFENLEQAWNADLSELIKCGLEENIAREIILKREEINVDEVMEKLDQEGINVLTIKDEKYPKLLKEIYSPPALLYYKGRLSPEQDEFSLAVVGTRKFSSYGRQVTPEIVRTLAKSGLVIVSGLALGIDSLAHEASLDVKGRTLAVLGSGLDRENIYPSYNRYLADEIVDSGGLLISEYPPGTRPLKHFFPQRNRIISGLSLGTLVIEAPEDSGALLTARYALEQNREIFAVPGSIYNENSFGTNNLIKMGAKLVSSAQDILEALDLTLVKEFVENKKIIPDSKEEALILEHLSSEPIHIDELVRRTNLDTKTVNSTLTLMEMKGRARNLGGMMYVISR